MDGRTLLRHTGHGGTFDCPDEAVEGFAALGWVPAIEAPDEAVEGFAAVAAPDEEPTTGEAEPPDQPPVKSGKKSVSTDPGSE